MRLLYPRQRSGRPPRYAGKIAALLDAEFERFDAVYQRHFSEPRRVRTTVGAAHLGGAKVQVTAVAGRPAGP